MTRSIKWITLANTVMILALLSVMMFQHIRRERTAYVDLNKLFNGYTYKAIADKEFKQTMVSRNNLLDSLEMAIISAQNVNDTARARKLGNLYYQKQQAFEQESEKLSTEMTARVWAQLSQYTADFAKSEKISCLFGSKGDGNIMYAAGGKDVTEQALIFVNKCYDDEK